MLIHLIRFRPWRQVNSYNTWPSRTLRACICSDRSTGTSPFTPQQRRAVNLVHALITEKSGLDGKSVAIVGAGFAGLTAAAFAVERTDAALTLSEDGPARSLAARPLHKPLAASWHLRLAASRFTGAPLVAACCAQLDCRRGQRRRRSPKSDNSGTASWRREVRSGCACALRRRSLRYKRPSTR